MKVTYAMARENAARSPSRSTLAAPFREAWFAPARSGTFAHDGLLYVTDFKGHIAALDAITGRRVWTSPWESTPWLVHEGWLFTRPDDQPEIHLVDPRTGHPRSAIFTPHRGELLGVGNRLIGCPWHGEAVVWAVDWTSGQRLWSAHDRGNSMRSPYSCATDEAIVYGVEDGTDEGLAETLVARRSDDGRELWRRTAGRLYGTPSIHGDRVVSEMNDLVTALSLRDGALLWETEGTGGYRYGDRYYCLKVDSLGAATYQVLDVASGKVLSRVDLIAGLPASLRNTRPSKVMFVSESHVFVRGNEFLLVFTRDGGEYVWKHHPRMANILGEILGGDQRLYYRHRDRLFCLESVNR